MSEKLPNYRFGTSFYVANTMEIFERLAWYGFFAVSSVYMTSPLSQGGLGFSDEQRGLLQGLIPFLLYLLPAFTGALGDRYGYKRMFIIAFAVMSPAYFLLGQAKPFWLFTIVFIGVAVGAAIFKPLVVATVSRTTNDHNRGLGFGIFYVMVNIGGFIGPLVAGYVRAISWDWVFVMASVWIAINFIPVLFFYREPQIDSAPSQQSFRDVLLNLVHALGNVRFMLLILPIVVLLLLTPIILSWSQTLIGAASWCVINLLWSRLISRPDANAWYHQTLGISNKPFLLYLLMMAGFWATYNQLFITLPLYIRDFVDTAPLVQWIASFSPVVADQLAMVNIEQLARALPTLLTTTPFEHGESLRVLQLQLAHHKVFVPLNEIAAALPVSGAAISDAQAQSLSLLWASQFRQINPEYLLSLNFGSILIFQIFISRWVQFHRAIHVLLVGTLLTGVSFIVFSFSGEPALGAVMALIGILLFSFGEMLASPKSQDYVAGVMPKAQAAMYMGYYFVSMALGFLFAGILSGWAYQTFVRDLQHPEWMWFFFTVIAFVTAAGLFWFNRRIAPEFERQKIAHE